MASLYDIKKEILECIDQETGEILDTDKFDQLQISRNEKIENIGLYYKNLLSDADQLKIEKERFAEREQIIRNKADSLKKYLDYSLHGEKFGTVKLNISYRKSSSVEIVDQTLIPKDYLKTKTVESIDKMAISKDIKSGKTVSGAELVEHNNIQIK